VIPEKSCLRITGYSSPYLPAGGFIGEADDTGGAIKGYHVDIFINASESQVNSFGIQSVHVTDLGPATNPAAAGTAACAGYENGQASTTGTAGTGQGSATPATGGSGGSVSASGSSFGASVAKLAEAELGKPYVWGGTSPAGFDCSGLVQWVFAHLGVKLPRLSGQQYQVGTSVSKANLQPGDLVFFTTYKPGPSHVGIYIGATSNFQHAFVAADNPSVGVTINNLDSAKWTRLFVGARHIALAATVSANASSTVATSR
jgi:cell wall-associated NlpC family hydrolase